jgi:hypothetical protein
VSNEELSASDCATRMNASSNRSWLGAMILFGFVYLVVGITFAWLAGSSASNETRVMWRRAAWLASASAFAVHLANEHFRSHNSPSATALHASLAAALGAFGLAVAANVHALWANSENQYLIAAALVLWPIMIAVPAFVVALAVAAVLARMRPRV